VPPSVSRFKMNSNIFGHFIGIWIYLYTHYVHIARTFITPYSKFTCFAVFMCFFGSPLVPSIPQVNGYFWQYDFVFIISDTIVFDIIRLTHNCHADTRL
jgi:hypothetical protein